VFPSGDHAMPCGWNRLPRRVYTDGREAECERTLLRKIKDLHNLI